MERGPRQDETRPTDLASTKRIAVNGSQLGALKSGLTSRQDARPAPVQSLSSLILASSLGSSLDNNACQADASGQFANSQRETTSVEWLSGTTWAQWGRPMALH